MSFALAQNLFRWHFHEELIVDRQEAEEASESEDFRRRIEAAATFVSFTDDAAYTSCLKLLLDRDDTAVCKRTAEALIARGDTYAAGLMFSGLALSTEPQGFYFLNALHNAWLAGNFDVDLFGEHFQLEGFALARQGVRVFVDWMHLTDLESPDYIQVTRTMYQSRRSPSP